MGTGIYETDGSANNQIVNVNAANRNVALDIAGDSQVLIAGVNFSDSIIGLRLYNVEGVQLGVTTGMGWDTEPYRTIELHNVRNAKISDINLSWTRGLGGTGISVTDGSSGNTIRDVGAAHRSYSLDIHGDSQIEIENVDFTGSYFGLHLYNVSGVHFDPSISGLAHYEISH